MVVCILVYWLWIFTNNMNENYTFFTCSRKIIIGSFAIYITIWKKHWKIFQLCKAQNQHLMKWFIINHGQRPQKKFKNKTNSKIIFKPLLTERFSRINAELYQNINVHTSDLERLLISWMTLTFFVWVCALSIYFHSANSNNIWSE